MYFILKVTMLLKYMSKITLQHSACSESSGGVPWMVAYPLKHLRTSRWDQVGDLTRIHHKKRQNLYWKYDEKFATLIFAFSNTTEDDLKLLNITDYMRFQFAYGASCHCGQTSSGKSGFLKNSMGSW